MPEVVKLPEELIRAAETKFAIKIESFYNYRLDFLPDNATVHSITLVANNRQLDNEQFLEVSNWFLDREWTVSRQLFDYPPFNVVRECIAPITNIHLKNAYHATPTVSIRSIMKEGLFPGERDRCNSDRLDTLGNIYVSSELGRPGDESRNKKGTAHWWREHLAKNNRFDDSDWSILQVDVAALDGLKCFRDIWSNSGIVIRTNDPIEPRYLTPVEGYNA